MDGAEQAELTAARVMTWNVLHGGWPRLEEIEAVIRAARPAIIGLQEIERRTLDALAERLGMTAVFGPPRGGRGAPVGLLSRWPVTSAPSHVGAPLRNAMLEAEIAPPGAEPLRVFVVHLAAGYSGWRGGEGARLRELRELLTRVAALPAPQRERLLLMGDFNSLAPGEPLLAARLLRRAADLDAARAKGEELPGLPRLDGVLPGPLRPLGSGLTAVTRWGGVMRLFDLAASVYVPRTVVATTRAAGLVDLAAAAQPDPRQRELTCPADLPAGRIDYLFASPALAKALIACETLDDAPARPVSAASDHRPVIATLAL